MNEQQANAVCLAVRAFDLHADIALHATSGTHYVRIWLGQKVGYVIHQEMSADELSIALKGLTP